MSNGAEINESILMAYLNKELSNEDMIKVDLWLTQSSENMKKFNEIRDVWKAAGQVSIEPVDVDANLAWDKVKSQIQNGSTKTIPMQPDMVKRKLLVGVAAAMVLFIGIGALLIFNSSGAESGNLDLVAENEVISAELPDGSEVSLNENSVLSYPPEFSEDERRVELKGEAFFDIERNEEKPFIIDLPDDAYVKVLGTSFNIDAKDDEKEIEVFVNSGRVEFGNDENTVILTAGEKAVMKRSTGEVTKIEDDVQAMREMFWIDKYLDFDGVPLAEVVETLDAVFEEEIQLKCDDKADVIINSVFRDEDLEAYLYGVLGEVADLKVQKDISVLGHVSYELECDD